MQASDLFTQTISTQSVSPKHYQSSLPLLLQWSNRASVVMEVGLVLLGLFGVQQVLVGLCGACWQMLFLFTLIGLMIVLMLGHYYLNQLQSKYVKHWIIVSNAIVTILGIGVIACILTTPIMT